MMKNIGSVGHAVVVETAREANEHARAVWRCH